MSEEKYLKWPAKLWPLERCRSLCMMENTLKDLFLVVVWYECWTCFFVLHKMLYVEIGT